MHKRRRLVPDGGHEPAPAAALPLLLQQRELGACRPAQSSRRIGTGLLQCLALQTGVDAHDEAATATLPGCLRARAAVAELVVHKGLAFALLTSGLCPVFDSDCEFQPRIMTFSSSSSSLA